MSPKNRLAAAALALALPLDQLSKLWIVDNFHYGERMPLISGWLDITHVRNPGGAFSFFANGPVEQRMIFFIGTTLLAIVMLVTFLRRLEPDARLAAFAVGAILGGALGNLIDRIAYGEVIDFIDVYLWGGRTWPTFNFADSFIVVGVGLLIGEIFSEEAAARAERARGDSPEAAGAAPIDPARTD